MVWYEDDTQQLATTTAMAFAKNLILFLVSCTFALVVASPVHDATNTLAKRGAVLSAQYATESEVSFQFYILQCE